MAKLKPIDNWRHCWRFSSLQLAMIAIVFDTLFIIISVWNETFPMEPIWYASLRLLLTLLSMGARLVQQRATGGKEVPESRPE